MYERSERRRVRVTRARRREWAPFESVGTHRHPFTVDARARAILGRLSASSPRDGRGVVHAANARHAVDVTSWAAPTTAHTTTATATATATA